ncbi:hypothetical protein O3M35_000823 [Rhynocoris fuscipes]|uniref:Cytochrome P450 n=1 Tax=Rhynocoris fuscipes TaxID=488301 RepID=A0AAW1DTE0_9HEMI
MLVEVLLLLLLVWLFYKQWCNAYKYWEQKGFPYIKGTFPFGSYSNLILLREYAGQAYKKLYDRLEPHPFGGIYLARKRELILRDPEFIKRVLIKDFSYFKARSDFPEISFLQKHLFSAEGDLWRALRVKLTPTFTSGKLKTMFSLFKDCSNKLDGHFKQLADNEEVIDAKDWMARFTTDIICTCAFGLEVNSLEKPDNELRLIGQSIFKPRSFRNILTRVIALLLPFLSKIMTVTAVIKKLEMPLLKIITDTVEYRERNNIRRNDFLDLLIDIMKKDNLTVDKHEKSTEDGIENSLKMDLKLMTAQSFIFFAAGFETSSSVLANCLYELSMNPSIQDKLRDEIDSVLKKHTGEITYQAIHEMPYLEQVINETMRKYPTLPVLNRISTKQYFIPEMNLVIDKNTRLLVPVYGLHHDPKYYPEPEKFIPERFAPENKSSIPSCAYLPFGEGPRNCIGMRFGLLQTKTGIVTTLSKYRLIKTEKTPNKLTFEPTSFVSNVKDKITLKIVHR